MKSIFTLLFLLSAAAGFSQNTYYWVGGTNGAFGLAANFNTALDGSGFPRTTPNMADVLIFDGTNIGGATPAAGPVTPVITGGVIMSRLLFQNAVTVTLKRDGSTNSGTTSFTINGDGNTATDDFSVSAGSTVNMTSTQTGYGFQLVLGSAGTLFAVGRVFGNVSLIDGGFATLKITATNPSSLIVEAGGVVTGQITLASAYPFGTGTSTPAAASFGVVFNALSKLIYLGGNSVVGNVSAFQSVRFNPGSTLEMNAANPSGMFANKTYANILVKAPAAVNLASDNFYNIDTLTINTGASFNMRTTGFSPFSGDIINNGTFGAGAVTNTSANMVMIGIVPQTIGGSGTFNSLGAISTGTDAQVTLERSISIIGSSTSNITGKLNVQTNTVSGTAPIQFRAANPGTPTPATITQGGYTVTFADLATYNAANVTIGARVTGPAFSPATYVIGTASGTFTFTISKPAIADFPGVSGTVTLVTVSPTLETSNPGGADGSFTTTGARTFGTGTNYIFDAATVTPFSTSTTNTAGNVTFNAAVTTNKTNQNIAGILTLNSNNKITIRSTDTLRVRPLGSIASGSFDNSKYFITEEVGANTGVLRIDSITAVTLFPVGSAGNYLPARLTPTAAMDFAVSAFEGITTDGTPAGGTGTVLGNESVNAVWLVNRTNGTGNCNLELNWVDGLEGSTFATLQNSEIGISRYDGTMYETAIGSGDNTLNIANAAFSNYSPFIVTKKTAVVPVLLKSITASKLAAGTKILWEVSNEISIEKYVVERSVNGTDFVNAGEVAAANRNAYSFNDVTPLVSQFYYRIKVLGTGTVKYSAAVKVTAGKAANFSIYPNPVANSLNVIGAKASAIRIINANAQVVYSKKISADFMNIDVSALKSGYYIIEVADESGSIKTKSFIKE